MTSLRLRSDTKRKVFKVLFLLGKHCSPFLNSDWKQRGFICFRRNGYDIKITAGSTVTVGPLGMASAPVTVFAKSEYEPSKPVGYDPLGGGNTGGIKAASGESNTGSSGGNNGGNSGPGDGGGNPGGGYTPPPPPPTGGNLDIPFTYPS